MVITNRFLITTSLWVFAGAAHAQAAGCEALMAQIDAKIRAGGVTQFILTTVDASAECRRARGRHLRPGHEEDRV